MPIKNNRKRKHKIYRGRGERGTVGSLHKNKNNINININSNNKRKGGSSGGQRQQSHPVIIQSSPHVPYLPADTGTHNLYPILSDIKERLTAQAKQPQEVKEFVGVSEPNVEIKKEPAFKTSPNTVKVEKTPKSVKVAPEDNSFSKYYDTHSITSINDVHSPIFPLNSAPPVLPSPYTPIKQFDGRVKIKNPTGKGPAIYVGGDAYKRYVKQGLIKDIR